MTELTLRPDLLALIRERDEILSETQAIVMQVRALEARKQEATGCGLPRDCFGYDITSDYYKVEKLREKIDRDFWRRAIKVANLYTMMSSSERDKFNNQLEKNVPTFDIATVHNTVTSNLSRSDEMLISGLYDVWTNLKPYFKSHDGVGFGTRLIFQNAVDYNSVKHYHHGSLYDLDKTVSILTKEKVADNWYQCRLQNVVDRAIKCGDAEDEFYRVKVYANGNLHLFIAPGIIPLLNETLAKASQHNR